MKLARIALSTTLAAALLLGGGAAAMATEVEDTSTQVTATASVMPHDPITSSISITGDAIVGGTLTVVLPDPDDYYLGVAFETVWFSNGAAVGSGTSYTVQASDAGATITALVTPSYGPGETEPGMHAQVVVSDDTDDDGLTDDLEAQLGTDPTNHDSDYDYLYDGAEYYGTDGYVTDPTKWDTDGDGLGDEVDYAFGTDPTLFDTDGDTLGDGAETYDHATNPLMMDTDGGTMDDGTEVARGSNPLDAADDVVVEPVVPVVPVTPAAPVTPVDPPAAPEPPVVTEVLAAPEAVVPVALAAPATADPSAVPDLAETGSEAGALAAVAGGLVLAGGAVLVGSRRRRHA